MIYLWAVTLLWAFSFSLIGVYLSATVDAYFAVFTRALLASLLFLPFLRWKGISVRWQAKLMGIGAIQLGVMYLFLYQSFSFLSVPEVLLFTIFTPIYIALMDDALQRRFTPRYVIIASIAVLGAGIIRYNQLSAEFLIGFLLVQGANACFAFGQIAYKHLVQQEPEQAPLFSGIHTFGYFYLGALLVSLLGLLLFGDSTRLPTQTIEWSILLWLGLVASGCGYFLWNKGAALVDTGVLAVMNNLLIPAGLLVNLLIWSREVDLLRLSLGCLVMLGALLLNHYWARAQNHLAQDTTKHADMR
ncbi:EamA family transporter [Marinospirillum sp.]|uniref:EamA family transporter n=1 Tax=Marinospirillum sp. TaxID=2183934 RepID=UPI003A8BB33B